MIDGVKLDAARESMIRFATELADSTPALPGSPMVLAPTYASTTGARAVELARSVFPSTRGLRIAGWIFFAAAIIALSLIDLLGVSSLFVALILLIAWATTLIQRHRLAVARSEAEGAVIRDLKALALNTGVARLAELNRLRRSQG